MEIASDPEFQNIGIEYLIFEDVLGKLKILPLEA